MNKKIAFFSFFLFLFSFGLTPGEAKEKDEVKSYKIVVDSNKKDDTLILNEVDNQFEKQHYVIEIKGE